MKSFSYSDSDFKKYILFRAIYQMSCFSLLQVHGALPCSISQRMTPIDHTSFLTVQMLPCKAQGLMQSGEPTFTVSLGLGPARLAKPKSAILTVLSLRRMLAGLRSRWRNPFSAIWMKPMSIYRMSGRASSSDSFYRFLRRFSRSPSLQNSVMMQQLLAVLKMSWHLSTLGWLSFLSASISPSNIRFYGLPWMARMSITLTATFSLVLSLVPRYTTELKPRPITSFKPQEQSSIFFRNSLLGQWLGFCIQIRFNRLTVFQYQLHSLLLFKGTHKALSITQPFTVIFYMQDFRGYIKKEIATLLQLSQTPHWSKDSAKGTRRQSLSILNAKNVKPRTFWEEFSRENIGKNALPYNLKDRKQQITTGGTVKRSNSVFMKRMIEEEDTANYRIMAGNISKAKQTGQKSDKNTEKSKDKQRRATVYQKISDPISLPRETSGVSDGYLSAKHRFRRRVVSSMSAVRLWKS